jgi:ubiquinone/menaquinone biosynthesis C-methylase UbiE
MKRDFDADAKTWDSNESRRRMSLAIADAMREALTLSGDETLLDYGTGTGVVALRMQPFVREVIAADSSRGMLDVLEEKARGLGVTNVRTVLLDLERAPEPPRDLRPDVLVSSMTLHHVADTARLAETLFGMMAPGGRLAIADLDTEGGKFHSDNTGVEHFGFDRDELGRTFSRAGFEDLRFRTAHDIVRPSPSGDQSFSVFLLTGQKPARR